MTSWTPGTRRLWRQRPHTLVTRIDPVQPTGTHVPMYACPDHVRHLHNHAWNTLQQQDQRTATL